MNTIVIFISLLGGVLVSADDSVQVISNKVGAPSSGTIDDGFLRGDFQPIFNAFMKNLDKTIKSLSGKAKERLIEFKKQFLDLKVKVETELQTLRKNLIQRLHEAKNLGKDKYEEVRHQVAEDLKQKKVEWRDKILKLQQEITKFLREMKIH
ncbi:hypothetical protein QAD02_008858 [Eretmocerus hayati]|uniref:Uncharacterized protein n=1 Tax=Eretmocerus hayati TaxID=131215 RepID=A0ACC2N937_9HYME|nr:hypothetical protein QAD02_008858 [Eretmocerus hayati]